MSSSSVALSRELAAAGVKAAGTFNDIRFGPFVFSCLLTDNSTASVNLRAAVVIADAQLDTLGATADNPPIYLVVTGYKLAFPMATESESVIRQIVASPYLHHEPTKGPQRQIMLADGIGTVADASSVAISSAGPTSMFTRGAKSVKLKNPMVIAMRRETFEIRYQAAVDTTANLIGLLELYGYAMPDDVPLSPISIDCVSEADAKVIGRSGIAPGNLL